MSTPRPKDSSYRSMPVVVTLMAAVSALVPVSAPAQSAVDAKGHTFDHLTKAAVAPVDVAACTPLVDATGPLAARWSQVRAALATVARTMGTNQFTFRSRFFERSVDLNQVVRREEAELVTGVGTIPFAAADPERTLSDGFVSVADDGTTTFFVPNPATLLAESFAQTHCLTMANRPDATRQLGVGVGFAPLESGGNPDIRGQIWVNSASGTIDAISFAYTDPPSGIDDARIGGEIEFVALDDSTVVVRSWVVRMPSTRADASGTASLVGFTEVGTTVLDVVAAAGDTLYADHAISVLTGTVFDSVQQAFLPDAVILIDGTEEWTTTDGAGQFLFAGLQEGRYHIRFGHPRLDSLGFIARPTVVDLRRGSYAAVSLAAPPIEQIVRDRCEEPLPEDRRLLIGVVRDAETNQPVPGAMVAVNREFIPEHLQGIQTSGDGVTAFTDGRGSYTVCGVPVGQAITVGASQERRTSDFSKVIFNVDAVGFDGAEPIEIDAPVARLDLVLQDPASHRAEVRGTVTHAITGRPIADAAVQIDGTRIGVRTDSAGAFHLRGVPRGPVPLVIRILGYEMIRRTVAIEPGASIDIPSSVLAMEPARAGTELDPIVVEASAVPPYLRDFEERRATGVGSFALREDFEKWNPHAATDILRRMPGIRVVPNNLYGSGGDTRRYRIESSRDIGQRITRIVTNDAARAATTAGDEVFLTECPMLIFWDGVFAGDSRDTNVDNLISTTSLEAVEVYTTSQVPARFAFPGSTCGVIVFWSRSQ